MFTVGPRACPGPRPRVFRYWSTEPAARLTGRSYRMPLSRWYQEERTESFSCTTYL